MADSQSAFHLPGAWQGQIIERGGNQERLTFQYNPEQIDVRSSAKWVKHKIPGVHHPRLQYAGGDGREMSFQIHVLDRGSGGDADITHGGWARSLEETILWLESLTYPDITASSLKFREPPRVIVNFSSESLTMPAVITEVKRQHKLFFFNMNTRYAVLDLTIVEDRVRAQGYKDLRP